MNGHALKIEVQITVMEGFLSSKRVWPTLVYFLCLFLSDFQTLFRRICIIWAFYTLICYNEMWTFLPLATVYNTYTMPMTDNLRRAAILI